MYYRCPKCLSKNILKEKDNCTCKDCNCIDKIEYFFSEDLEFTLTENELIVHNPSNGNTVVFKKPF